LFQSPRAITRPTIIGMERNVHVAGTYSVTHVHNSEIKQLSPLFFAMLGDNDLICGCIMISYRSSSQLFQSPRAITRPTIIGMERNVHLICSSSLYTHIPKIKLMSPSIAKTKYLAKFQSPRAITQPSPCGIQSALIL
jgi:hypothetical protein